MTDFLNLYNDIFFNKIQVYKTLYEYYVVCIFGNNFFDSINYKI